MFVIFSKTEWCLAGKAEVKHQLAEFTNEEIIRVSLRAEQQKAQAKVNDAEFNKQHQFEQRGGK